MSKRVFSKRITVKKARELGRSSMVWVDVRNDAWSYLIQYLTYGGIEYAPNYNVSSSGLTVPEARRIHGLRAKEYGRRRELIPVNGYPYSETRLDLASLCPPPGVSVRSSRPVCGLFDCPYCWVRPAVLDLKSIINLQEIYGERGVKLWVSFQAVTLSSIEVRDLPSILRASRKHWWGNWRDNKASALGIVFREYVVPELATSTCELHSTRLSVHIAPPGMRDCDLELHPELLEDHQFDCRLLNPTEQQMMNMYLQAWPQTPAALFCTETDEDLRFVADVTSSVVLSKVQRAATFGCFGPTEEEGRFFYRDDASGARAKEKRRLQKRIASGAQLSANDRLSLKSFSLKEQLKLVGPKRDLRLELMTPEERKLERELEKMAKAATPRKRGGRPPGAKNKPKYDRFGTLMKPRIPENLITVKRKPGRKPKPRPADEAQ